MHVNKQLFWRTLGVMMIFESSLLLIGCGWESQAISVINLLRPAIAGAVNVLIALGVAVSPDVVAKFNSWADQAVAALNTVEGLINQYKQDAANNAPASTLTGILQDINTAISDVGTQLATILPELHITNPTTQGYVTAVFGAISGFVATLLNLIPALKASVATPMTEDQEHEMLDKLNLSVKDFRKQYNDAIKELGGKTI